MDTGHTIIQLSMNFIWQYWVYHRILEWCGIQACMIITWCKIWMHSESVSLIMRQTKCSENWAADRRVQRRGNPRRGKKLIYKKLAAELSIFEYSGDLYNEHLNSGNIWIANFKKSGIQIIPYSDARYLLLTGKENSGQIVSYSDHHSNNRLKKFGI